MNPKYGLDDGPVAAGRAVEPALARAERGALCVCSLRVAVADDLRLFLIFRRRTGKIVNKKRRDSDLNSILSVLI